MNESSSGSLGSSAVGGVGVLGFDCSRSGVVASLLFSFVLPWGCDAEHAFLCLFAMCIFPLVSCPPFESGCLFSYCWVVRGFCIFQISNLSDSIFSIYFPPVCDLSSQSLDTVFCRAEFLNFKNFNKVQLVNSCSHRSCLWSCTLKAITTPKAI